MECICTVNGNLLICVTPEMRFLDSFFNSMINLAMSFSIKVFPEVLSVEVNKGPYGYINSHKNSDKKWQKCILYLVVVNVIKSLFSEWKQIYKKILNIYTIQRTIHSCYIKYL